MHHHHVAGLTGHSTAYVIMRPVQAPHQTMSDVGLLGGRLEKPSPGSRGRKLALSIPCILRRGNFLQTDAHPEQVLTVHSRVLHRFVFVNILDFNLLATFAARLLSVRGSARVQ